MERIECSDDLMDWTKKRLSSPDTDREYRISFKEQIKQNEIAKIVEAYKHFAKNIEGDIDTVVDGTIINIAKTKNSRDGEFVRIGEQWIKDKNLIDTLLRKNQKRIEGVWAIINKDEEIFNMCWKLADEIRGLVNSLETNRKLTLIGANKKLIQLESLTGKKFNISATQREKDIKDMKVIIDVLSDPDFVHKSIMFTMLVDCFERLELPILFATGPRQSSWIVPAYLQWLRITGWKHIYSMRGSITTGKRITDTNSEIIDDIRKETMFLRLELQEVGRRMDELPDIPHVPELPGPEEEEKEDGKEE